MADEPGNDPAWRLIEFVRSGRSFSGRERNCVFLNTHQSRFASVSAVSGIDFPDDARAVGRVDWDGDGDLDLWISNRNGPQCRLLINQLPHAGNWITLDLEGRTSNRDAIGARVQVTFENDAQPPIVRSLRAGDGYMTQSSKSLLIGLGDSPGVCDVQVRWPSGQVTSLSKLSVNRRYHLVEGASAAEAIESVRNLQLKATPPRLPESTDRLQVMSQIRPFLPGLEYLDQQMTTRNVMDFKGAPTLVVLWATWCQPCLVELAELTEHASDLKAAGLQVLALSIDRLSSEGTAHPEGDASLLRKLSYPFAAGAATEPLLDKLQLVSDFLFGLQKPFPVPTSFLIDKDFRLAAIYRGPLDIARLREDLNNLAVKDTQRRPLTVPFSGRWAEDPTTLPMAVLVMELINAGFVEDASEFVQRTQHIYDRATILDLVVRLGMAHFSAGATERAELHFQMARKLEPNTVGPEINLGQWYESKGEYQRAREQYRAALQRSSRSLPAMNNLAWLLATCPEDAVRDGAQAVQLANRAVQLTRARHAGLLDTLAASLAEVGRYDEAEQTGEQAIQLARAASQFNLAGEIEARVARYQARQSYRMPPK